jgi:hypothetical protein
MQNSLSIRTETFSPKNVPKNLLFSLTFRNDVAIFLATGYTAAEEHLIWVSPAKRNPEL